MRLTTLYCLLCFAGFCVAQDTNFPVGPQYLVTGGSPQFLQPIATPSLSFNAPVASAPAATSEAGAGEQTAPAPMDRPATANFARIYWGQPSGTGNGGEGASEIEVSSKAPSTPPASLVDVGVVEVLDARALSTRGYGMTVAETALFWKAHKTRASHIYTNADIARLHGG